MLKTSVLIWLSTVYVNAYVTYVAMNSLCHEALTVLLPNALA